MARILADPAPPVAVSTFAGMVEAATISAPVPANHGQRRGRMNANDRAARTCALTTGIAPVRANKYHARKCTVDGIRFDSTREATRYQELKILERAGMIRALELQPEFPIVVVECAYRLCLDQVWRWKAEPGRGPVQVGRYRADFRYVETDTGAVVVEDAKSPATRTTAYRLRKRLVQAIHGIVIREV
jgi:hypothetical protein